MESQPTDGPGAELQQVAVVLRHALAEVCGTEIRQANTGELRRFEEVLGVANDAARQLVDLRTREKQRHRATASPPQARLGESAGDTGELAHRVFVDDRGVTWDAFAVHPSVDSSGRIRLPEPFQRGWLSFDSGAERRRLSPIPEEWQTAPDAALVLMCMRAEPAPRRAGSAQQGGG